MKNSSIITLKDLDRIKNTIAPLQNEAEIRKSYDLKLKEINAKKMKEWPNSLENKEKAKLEFQKRKFLKDEAMRRIIDEEEEKFQNKKKEMITEKAREKYFFQQAPVKDFVNKMRFSDILHERKIQLKQSQLIKNRWKLYDDYWDDIEKKKMEDYDRKEIEKQINIKNKNEENMNYIKNQFQDYKRKKIEELQDNYVEGQIIKLNAQNELKEEERKKMELKAKQEKMREDFKKENEELMKLKEKEKLKEDEEMKRIEFHAKKKEEIDELRKRKEKEKFEFKQSQRQKLIDHQFEMLQKLKAEEEAKTQKDMNLKEKEDIARELMKEEKKKQMEKEIEEDRQLYLKRKEEEKEKKKLEDANQLEEFRKQIKEMEEEEKNKYLERRKRERNLNEYQRRQADERRQRAITDFNELQSDNYKNKYLLYKEQDEFISFAEEQIKKYAKEGKDIAPMIQQLTKYKKEYCIN